jgi:hypothetical protein
MYLKNFKFKINYLIKDILSRLRMEMNESTKNLNNTKSQKEALDNMITRELEVLKHELYEKLNSLIDGLKKHQNNQRTDALKLQQEISILKKEKSDLQQRVTGIYNNN